MTRLVEMAIKSKPVWLLLSDIHFKSYDLDRITRTANWVASIPNEYNISRAVICGDLLTTRTSQPTHVLSACYHFLNKLIGAVPHVNILLGNHDLAYRFDHTTSALEAVAINRLAPFVTLHTDVGCHEWDGRQVLVMPFREDQSQILRFIRDLDSKSAAATVGFGHLAINRAITQKYIVDGETGKPGLPSKYPGLTGAGGFAPLARTFTGHFHSHQTILQAASQRRSHYEGSITYIGAPLQLTWADLFDTEKGVILLDPDTLEYELVQNPHAQGYMTVEAEDVLTDKICAEKVHSKHVMITGKLSQYKYISARDRLVKLGVRSIRNWKVFEPEFQFGHRGLGKTTLPVDVQDQSGCKSWQDGEKAPTLNIAKPAAMVSSTPITERVERAPIDLGELVHEYLSSLNLGSTLEGERKVLTLVGKRLADINSCVDNKTGCTMKYREMLDQSAPLSPNPSNDAIQATTPENIFGSYPVAIEITNFLGVQSTVSLEFKKQFQPGMNFVVGRNGAGKSTIIEAIVWCQFGQCIREGLAVDDVVNDVVKKNCYVRITFANGYTISRFRKHSKFHSRVLVEKNGVIQPQFEGPNVKSTQASINGLLGIDFDTFIRTILLGNESTRSFLSASPLQRRQLMEASLGLGVLDGCAEACNSMLSQVDKELGDKQSRLKEVTHTIIYLERRVSQMEKTLMRLLDEEASFANELQKEEKKQATSRGENELKRQELRKNLQTEKLLPPLEPDLLCLQRDISRAQSEVENLSVLDKLVQARLSAQREGAIIKQAVMTTRTKVYHLEEQLERLLEENDALESLVEDDTDTKRGESSSWQGFLIRLALVFPSLWAAILDIIRSVASPKSNASEKTAVFKVSTTRERQHKHIEAIINLSNGVTEMQTKVKAIMDRTATLTLDASCQDFISDSNVHTALANPNSQNASDVSNQLTAAAERLKGLTNRYDDLEREQEQRKQKQLRKQDELEEYEKSIDTASRDRKASIDRCHLLIASKGREIATYRGHLDSDAKALVKLNREATDLAQASATMHSHREIFAFWQSAFSQRRTAASKVTFRRYVIERHLGELNKLLGQVLMIMYQDAHYARSVTTRTIEALFMEEEESEKDKHGDIDNNINNNQKSAINTAPRVLDHSLSINPTLAYAKKSGGERKRVDLALFFALFMMGEARSAHMARYMVVDEAFDNLDVAGRTSMLKWCRWMTERLAYVLVITHSRDLVGIVEEEGGTDGSSVGATVITMKAGDKGTEVAVNGDCNIV